MKNTAGTRVHRFKVYVEDRMIDHLDSAEYDATAAEFSGESVEPSEITEGGERVWTF